MSVGQINLINNKNKKEPLFITYLFVIWAILMIIAVMITLYTPSKVKNRYYDEQIEAANLAKTAMQKIKEKKIELNISIPKEDKYQSGMIGELFSDITTTSGIIEAKRTAINPNFAAVYIDIFKEVGLKKGDQIALVMSGSFPTLNISAMAAAQVYGLETCIMASIGSSSYGANLVEFTFFDMAEYLYDIDIFTKRIDYISFGGANDDGKEYPTEVVNELLERMNKRGYSKENGKFLCESDFYSNIKKRTDLIIKKCPSAKLLISVGGTLVAMGEGNTGTTLYRGLVKPSYLNTNKNVPEENLGLLDTFLNRNIPIVQMLNIKGIAQDYGIEYDPDTIPDIGVSDAYYEISYNLSIPIIALAISICLLGLYIVHRRNISKMR